MDSLDSIQAQIQFNLSADEFNSISSDFKELNNGASRVELAYDVLKKLNLFPEIIKGEKCDIKSAERRNYGNHCFNKLKKMDEALRHYNKAVAYAKTSQVLALAYGNRSAVYFELREFDYCLKDIENAEVEDLSEELRRKLMDRKQRALSQTLIIKREEYFSEVPEVPISQKKHLEIECAGDGVHLNSTKELGRHLIASRQINPGEVIATESPFTSILLYEFYLSHCHHCLKPSPNLLPCTRCPLTLYCSKECLEASWIYHQYECGLLDTLVFIKASKLQLLALRIVILVGGPGGLDPSNPSGKVYQSGKYAEIHNLVTNEHLRSVSDLFSRATVAATFLYLLETTNFFQNSERQNIAGMLFRHLQTAPSNFHEISELRGRSDTGYEITEIGAAAYSFLSLLNHSCYPNVVRHCHGKCVVLRALKTIKKDEQLFDNYGYHFALMPKPERKQHLKDQYLFDCECEACANDYPLYVDLSRGHDNFVVEETELNELLCGNRETAIRLLPQLMENATSFEENSQEKRVEILDNQEVMKQCFAILANKNTLY